MDVVSDAKAMMVRVVDGGVGRLARLDPRDAEFLFGEHGGHRNHLVAVLFFDATGSTAQPVDLDYATRWMTDRLHLAPYFTRRVRRELLDLDYPYWVDAEPDLRAHVHCRSVEEAGWAPVGALLSSVVASPMDLARPPWELHVVTGIRDVHDMPEALTAVFLKVHHCAADGLAMRELTLSMFVDVPDGQLGRRPAGVPPAAMAAGAVVGLPQSVIRFVRGVGRARAAAQEIALAESSGAIPRLPSYPQTRLNSAASGRVVIDFITMPRDGVDVIRRAVPGSTVNDVLLAVVSGALRKSSGEDGNRPQSPLAAKVPRSVRLDEQWRSANQLVLLSIPLHNEKESPLERLAGIAHSAQEMKQRSKFPAVACYAARIEDSPSILLKFASRGDRHGDSSKAAGRADHTIVSNIAIDATGRKFAGLPGVGATPNQPPGDGDLLRHYMCFKDSETLTLNVCADPKVVPDVSRYCDVLRESFRALLDAARGAVTER